MIGVLVRCLGEGLSRKEEAMHYLRLTVLFAVSISLALILGLGPQKADAGACREIGLPDGCVESKDIASKAVNSARVKNNNLKAADLRDEAGADFASGNQLVSLTPAAQIVRSVTITAPRSGIVIVHASGSFKFAIGAGRASCSITQGSTIDSFHLITSKGDFNTQYVPFAATRGFKVSKGSTTFRLVCREDSGTVQVEDTSITAMYVPTRY
jgi:hypothetical protein